MEGFEIERRCVAGEGDITSVNGIEIDPCRYAVVEAYRNVTVRVLECVNCGHVEVEWTRQENTEDILNDED